MSPGQTNDLIQRRGGDNHMAILHFSGDNLINHTDSANKTHAETASHLSFSI